MPKLFSLVLLVLACLLQGCLGPSTPKSRLPVVVATTTFAADLVRQVAQDTVLVKGLMGPGVDPHLYRATPSDVVALSSADLIVYNGLMLEGRMTDLFEHQKRQKRHVHALADALPKEKLIFLKGGHGQADPHIWFDPQLWVAALQGLVAKLIELNPSGEPLYQKRLETLVQEYSHWDAWARQKLQEIPKNQRVLITSHDAFNYFGRAFDLEVVGVQGISTETEPGVQDVSQTVRLIKERGLSTIFVESSVTPKTIEQIAKNAGVRVGVELFSDAMGDPGALESDPDTGELYDLGTWVGTFRHNVNAVYGGLGKSRVPGNFGVAPVL